MYERFTDRARKVMAFSQSEASNLGFEYLAPEHILIGLLKEGSGVAAHVLKNMGIQLEDLRSRIAKLVVPAGEPTVFSRNLPQTPHAKKVILEALESAKELNHNYIGTEHILLGMARIEYGLTSILFKDIGITPEQIKNHIMNLLSVDENKSVVIAPQTYLEKVQALATRGHEGQSRSNGKPYITHPISVVNRLKNCGIQDEEVLATAYCHDLIEDTKITPEEIEKVAGKNVLEAVMQLTNIVPDGTSFQVKTASMLEHAKHYNDIAKRVKLADRYDNLADAIWDWKPERVKRYAQAGIELLNVMNPFPDDVKPFASEARRFFNCLV